MSEEFHGKSRTKITGSGGKRKKFRDKKLYEMGGHFTSTKIAEKDVRTSRKGIAGLTKVSLKRVLFASVSTKQGIKKAKIETVLESPQNRHHARENVLTKGTIIQTDAGKARITSRVGQDGIVNAVLL